jgi:fumarylacetoacetase
VLPLGIASGPGDVGPRLVVGVGSRALDLPAARRAGVLEVELDPRVLAASSLNPLLEAGAEAWRAVRGAAAGLAVDLTALPPGVAVDTAALAMHLPVRVGDYVDGYGGIHHAVNVGKIFRPGTEPLAPNWRHMPVAYHGRAGTVVVSGTPVVRPCGQVVGEAGPVLAPTARLDFELEVGAVVGTSSPPGRSIEVSDALDHVFGLVLLNDWSARDVQAYESQPLGPFLGKSFATSISAWVVPLDALRPLLVPGLPADQDPVPASYLTSKEPAVPDLRLQVLLTTAAMARAGAAPVVISEVRFAEAMYWSMAQQLAHATVNGASTRPGDLFGSGTVSGPDPRASAGSLLELTWGGRDPIELPGGERRTFLEDGDTVTLRGWCGPVDGGNPERTIALGEVTGTVMPARTV